MWCVVVCYLENLKNEEAMTGVGSQRHKKNIIHLITLINIYLLENLHLPQIVGGVRFSQGRKSILILTSRGLLAI